MNQEKKELKEEQTQPDNEMPYVLSRHASMLSVFDPNKVKQITKAQEKNASKAVKALKKLFGF